jgi:hypothetical protein
MAMARIKNSKVPQNNAINVPSTLKKRQTNTAQIEQVSDGAVIFKCLNEGLYDPDKPSIMPVFFKITDSNFYERYKNALCTVMCRSGISEQEFIMLSLRSMVSTVEDASKSS